MDYKIVYSAPPPEPFVIDTGGLSTQHGDFPNMAPGDLVRVPGGTAALLLCAENAADPTGANHGVIRWFLVNMNTGRRLVSTYRFEVVPLKGTLTVEL